MLKVVSFPLTMQKKALCKHVIKPSKSRSTQIKKHISSMHQIYCNECILSSQIVQPREDETLRNFNIMMQRLKADYGGQ